MNQLNGKGSPAVSYGFYTLPFVLSPRLVAETGFEPVYLAHGANREPLPNSAMYLIRDKVKSQLYVLYQLSYSLAFANETGLEPATTDLTYQCRLLSTLNLNKFN